MPTIRAGVHRLGTEIFEAMGYGALDVVNTPILVHEWAIDRVR